MVYRSAIIQNSFVNVLSIYAWQLLQSLQFAILPWELIGEKSWKFNMCVNEKQWYLHNF